MQEVPPEGFLLLTINNASLLSSSQDPLDIKGTLGLVCVTLNVENKPPQATPTSAPLRDVWLVLRVEGFEMPISPNQAILHSRSKRTFTFLPDVEGPKTSRITIVLPAPTDTATSQDLETFEVLLAQYALVQEVDLDPPGSDGDLKGRLVLVDQDDGQFIGTLGESANVHVHEDPNVATSGKDPVVVEISEDGKDVRVHTIKAEEEDMLLKSADYISRGIVFAASTIASGLNMASNQFISRTAPNPEPVVFTETTRGNVRRVHTLSGQAVQITAKTTGMIHSIVEQVAKRVAGRSKPAAPKDGQSTKLPLLNRMIMSTDMIFTAVEQGATHLVASGSQSISAGVRHRYGDEAGDAAVTFGKTAQNVSVVYIDVRGVGRRALLKSFGKHAFKARVGDRQVVLGTDEQDVQQTERMAEKQGVSGRNTTGSSANTPPSLPPREKSPAPPLYQVSYKAYKPSGSAPGARGTPALPPRPKQG